MFPRLAPYLFTTLLVLFPSSGIAQEQAAAEALFRSAQEAADRGDWQTACDRFEESHRLEPAPGTALNLARCREELGELASAWKRYREVIQRLPPADARVDYARRKEAELEPRIPRVVLLPPDDVDVDVTVGSMQVQTASFGVPLPFDPGPVEIIVRSKGREPWSITLNLEPGDRIEQRLQVGPPISETEDEVATAPDSGRASLWSTTALSIGGAGMATGVGGAIWALVELQTVQQECPDNRCTDAGSEAGARGRTATILMGSGFAVGVLGLGTGLYLLGKRDGANESQSGERTGPLTITHVGAAPVEDGGLVTIGGRF